MKTFTFFRNLALTCLLLFAMQSMFGQTFTFDYAYYKSGTTSWAAQNTSVSGLSRTQVDKYVGYRSVGFTGAVYKVTGGCANGGTIKITGYTNMSAVATQTVQIYALTAAPSGSYTLALGPLLGSASFNTANSTGVTVNVSAYSSYSYIMVYMT